MFGFRTKTLILAVIIFLFFLTAFSLWFFSYLKKLDQFPLAQVRITIPEGYTVKDIASRFNRFKNFDKDIFSIITRDKEGYLFPDTYFLTGQETETEVVEKMENNFRNKVGDIKKDILIMASLLEKEAKTSEDKKIISGILWKRLNTDMLLQVDASLDYDTYLYKGLPLAPICNPGLVSIQATLNPVDSPYWYYLSDKNSNIHYAKTFEEHKINKAKYLR
jgi:UPF0755 protein